jgi:hypothetical protein
MKAMSSSRPAIPVSSTLSAGFLPRCLVPILCRLSLARVRPARIPELLSDICLLQWIIKFQGGETFPSKNQFTHFSISHVLICTGHENHHILHRKLGILISHERFHIFCFGLIPFFNVKFRKFLIPPTVSSITGMPL